MQPRFGTAGLVLFVAASAAHGGYSHYFTWHQRPDEQALAACIAEMQLVMAAAGETLGDEGGEAAPELKRLRICFNGRGERACEPFEFPGGPGTNFCKTNWEPYDDAVVACLLVARDHFPPEVLEIYSDGSWAEGAWADCAALYTATLQRPARNPSRDPASTLLGEPVSAERREWPWLILFVVALAAVIFHGRFSWLRRGPQTMRQVRRR